MTSEFREKFSWDMIGFQRCYQYSLLIRLTTQKGLYISIERTITVIHIYIHQCNMFLRTSCYDNLAKFNYEVTIDWKQLYSCYQWLLDGNNFNHVIRSDFNYYCTNLKQGKKNDFLWHMPLPLILSPSFCKLFLFLHFSFLLAFRLFFTFWDFF